MDKAERDLKAQLIGYASHHDMVNDLLKDKRVVFYPGMSAPELDKQLDWLWGRE